MTDPTPSLALPRLAPAQAQKHVTVNEALGALDALVHLAVDAAAAEPPGDAVEGLRLLVSENATGAFEGRGGQIARLTDGAWRFFSPQAGWRAYDRQTGRWIEQDGARWREIRPRRLAVNAAPDETNRLVVAGDGALFTHDAADMRVTVNKAAPADTASLLFQSRWSGRAEIGLAGSDALTVKVSADGAIWRTALQIDPATGMVRQPGRVAFHASGFAVADAGTALTGFSAVAFNDANAFDAATGRFTAPVSGDYLFTWQFHSVGEAAASVDLVVDGQTRHRIGREVPGGAW